MKPLDIVYEDNDIIVINKPSGLLSIPGKGIEKLDSVTTRLKKLYPHCMAQPAVHRLDMDTSGLMVLAFEASEHRNLSIQFQEREVFKRYIAVLDGILEAKSGRMELPFRLDVDNRPLQIYDEEFGKMGITEWRAIEVKNGLTRVEFIPLTGRTHQLRIHSAHEKGLGIPIVGDLFYGVGPFHCDLQLHATELRFKHPTSGELMTFVREPSF